MQRPIHRLGIIVIILFTALILTNCSGGGGSTPPPPPPPPPPPTGMPYPPSSVIATAVSGTQINIIWSSVSDAISYNVYRSEQTGTAYIYTVVAGTTATIVSDTTVTSGTTYYYVISGTNSFGEGSRSVEVSATPAAPSGTLTITGTIKYEDKEYNQSVGLTGNTTFKAVRFAEVQLVSASSSTTTLGSTTTNSNGVYSISTSTNTGTTVYMRVISVAAPVGVNTVSVKDLSGTPALYAVKTADFILDGDSTANLSIPTTNTADGAFNILDVMTSGYEFVAAYTATSPPGLNAYWQPNSSYGTYYCDGLDSTYCIRGAGIYVYSNFDTDEFDDDVLWHEFGHFIANKYSKDDSPGGVHYLDDNTQDLRLSWSEGWGSFFPTAVKYWLNVTDPALLSANPSTTPLSQYVDTETGGLYLTVNIGAPETDACAPPTAQGPFDNCKYASNEISNANVLWNIMKDTGNLGIAKIWNVFDNYLPTVTAHNVNIEDFWDGFLASYPTDSTALHTVFSSRLIDYADDGYETDNVGPAARSYTQSSPQYHTLYGASDVDYIKFTAISSSHTIWTDNLRNGADTKLTLFAGPTVTYPAVTNDDATPPTTSPPPNTTTALSSKIQYLAFIPGQEYLISVQSGTNYLSAGRYGSYALTITSP